MVYEDNCIPVGTAGASKFVSWTLVWVARRVQLSVIISSASCCSFASVTVVVLPVNDNPVATNDTPTTTQGTAVVFSVLANDSDIDGDTLTANLLSAPANGSLTLNANGITTYTPDPNFSGTDSFMYQACDGNGGCDLATVTVTVLAPPAVPPVSPPVESPISTPVAPPAAAPVAAPVAPPVEPPVALPAAPPVAPPVAPAPITAPVAPPAAAPITGPVATPIAAPVAAPVRSPVTAPITAPVNINAPAVTTPIAVPAATPVTSPIAAPSSPALEIS